MQVQQQQKEEDKQRRKALWIAKQAALDKGGTSSFQIRGDPDNLRAAAVAEAAQAASPAT
jgi:hypothetical protein